MNAIIIQPTVSKQWKHLKIWRL